MSTSKNQTIKSLQQYDWSKESINQIIHYVKTKELPKGLDSRQRRRFKEKFSKNWDVHKAVFYDPYGAPPSMEIRDFVQQRKNRE